MRTSGKLQSWVVDTWDQTEPETLVNGKTPCTFEQEMALEPKKKATCGICFLFKKLIYSRSIPQVFRASLMELGFVGSTAFVKSIVAIHFFDTSLLAFVQSDLELGKKAGTLSCVQCSPTEKNERSAC